MRAENPSSELQGERIEELARQVAAEQGLSMPAARSIVRAEILKAREMRKPNPVPMQPDAATERRLARMSDAELTRAYKDTERRLYAEGHALARDALSREACGILWVLRQRGSRSPNPVGRRPRIAATEEQLAPMRQRMANAEADFLEAIAKAGDLTPEQAKTAFQTLRKHKALDMKDAYILGQIRVKHGGYLQRHVLRRAAGLSEEEAWREPNPTSPARDWPDELRRLVEQYRNDFVADMSGPWTEPTVITERYVARIMDELGTPYSLETASDSFIERWERAGVVDAEVAAELNAARSGREAGRAAHQPKPNPTGGCRHPRLVKRKYVGEEETYDYCPDCFYSTGNAGARDLIAASARLTESMAPDEADLMEQDIEIEKRRARRPNPAETVAAKDVQAGDKIYARNGAHGVYRWARVLDVERDGDHVRIQTAVFTTVAHPREAVTVWRDRSDAHASNPVKIDTFRY